MFSVTKGKMRTVSSKRRYRQKQTAASKTRMEIFEEAQEKFVKENEIEMEKLVESRKEEESQERKEELLKEARKRITEEMEEHRNYVNKIPEIFTKDLESLDDKNYINDGIITSGLAMLANAHGSVRTFCFTTRFYSALVANKPLRLRTGIWDFEEILIPVNYADRHWMLCRYLPRHNLMISYDPYRSEQVSKMVADLIVAYIRKVRDQVIFVEVQSGHQFPTQKDATSCGLYVLEYARAFLEKRKCNINIQEIPELRKRWREEIDNFRNEREVERKRKSGDQEKTKQVKKPKNSIN